MPAPAPPVPESALPEAFRNLPQIPSILRPGSNVKLEFGSIPVQDAVTSRYGIVVNTLDRRNSEVRKHKPDTEEECRETAKVMVEMIGIYSHPRIDGIPQPEAGKPDTADFCISLLTGSDTHPPQPSLKDSYALEIQGLLDPKDRLLEHTRVLKTDPPTPLTPEQQERIRQFSGIITTQFRDAEDLYQQGKPIPPEERRQLAVSVLNLITLMGTDHYSLAFSNPDYPPSRIARIIIPDMKKYQLGDEVLGLVAGREAIKPKERRPIRDLIDDEGFPKPETLAELKAELLDCPGADEPIFIEKDVTLFSGENAREKLQGVTLKHLLESAGSAAQMRILTTNGESSLVAIYNPTTEDSLPRNGIFVIGKNYRPTINVLNHYYPTDLLVYNGTKANEIAKTICGSYKDGVFYITRSPREGKDPYGIVGNGRIVAKDNNGNLYNSPEYYGLEAKGTLPSGKPIFTHREDYAYEIASYLIFDGREFIESKDKYASWLKICHIGDSITAIEGVPVNPFQPETIILIDKYDRESRLSLPAGLTVITPDTLRRQDGSSLNYGFIRYGKFGENQFLDSYFYFVALTIDDRGRIALSEVTDLNDGTKTNFVTGGNNQPGMWIRPEIDITSDEQMTDTTLLNLINRRAYMSDEVTSRLGMPEGFRHPTAIAHTLEVNDRLAGELVGEDVLRRAKLQAVDEAIASLRTVWTENVEMKREYDRRLKFLQTLKIDYQTAEDIYSALPALPQPLPSDNFPSQIHDLFASRIGLISGRIEQKGKEIKYRSTSPALDGARTRASLELIALHSLYSEPSPGDARRVESITDLCYRLTGIKREGIDGPFFQDMADSFSQELIGILRDYFRGPNMFTKERRGGTLSNLRDISNRDKTNKDNLIVTDPFVRNDTAEQIVFALASLGRRDLPQLPISDLQAIVKSITKVIINQRLGPEIAEIARVKPQQS